VTGLDTPNCLVANTATGTGGGVRCPLTLLPTGGTTTDCRGAMPSGARGVDFHEENPIADATHPEAGCKAVLRRSTAAR
jgi:hypothetical protein